MEQNLAERLSILKASGQISEQAAASVRYFVGLLEEKYSVALTEEKGAMLVTHLALALTRIEKGEDIQELAPDLLAEVKESSYYAELEPLLTALEQQSKLKITPAEQGYLALHLATALTEDG